MAVLTWQTVIKKLLIAWGPIMSLVQSNNFKGSDFKVELSAVEQKCRSWTSSVEPLHAMYIAWCQSITERLIKWGCLMLAAKQYTEPCSIMLAYSLLLLKYFEKCQETINLSAGNRTNYILWFSSSISSQSRMFNLQYLWQILHINLYNGVHCKKKKKKICPLFVFPYRVKSE